MNTTRYIAKCKACNCATSGLATGHDHMRAKNDPARTSPVYSGDVGNVFGAIALDCRKCGAPRFAHAVRGKFSAKHVCNAKCLSSTGTVCECSCAGKNHGAAYSATEAA